MSAETPEDVQKLVKQYENQRLEARSQINQIALYSDGAYHVRDLWAMPREQLEDVKAELIKKAEAQNPKKSNTRTF